MLSPSLPLNSATAPQLDSYIKRDADMVFRLLGEEMVLVPIRRGIGDFNSFYVLNPLGAFLWAQLETPKTIEQLLQTVLASYEVSQEQARSDLETFVNDLKALNALHVENGDSA